MHWLISVVLVGAGAGLILAFEPGMHAATAAALGCFLVSYSGAVMLTVGVATLVCNEAVEAAGRRVLGL